ncbi:MAG: dienelactone hydrolase family protein [Dongiaceae bacterium]
MEERKFDIATADGAMNSFVCHPDEGGPFPPVIFYQDAPGVRQELFDMARRLATAGYYVILPNLYYRTARDVVIDGNRAEIDGTYDSRRMYELIFSLTNTMPVEDTGALLAAIADDPQVRPGPVGALGYCMGGRFAACAAARYPELAAIAAYCATWMVSDRPDSAHLAVGRIAGEIYLACAEQDPYLPDDQIEELRRRMVEGGVRHRIEIYPGTRHAFAFRDRDTHQQAGEDRHWQRMIALFRRHLG